MPNVGDQLREARERQKLTVHDVANATNIKTDHVRAMEAGDWEQFSARVYIKGFVRTYATHLRVDVAGVLAQLEDELSRSAEFSEAPSLTGTKKGPVDWVMLQLSRVRWAIVFPVLLGIAVLVAAIYGLKAWQGHVKADPAKNLGPALHNTQRRPGGTPATLPLPTNLPVMVPGRR
jgi:cytoskeleton protein RodZ